MKQLHAIKVKFIPKIKSIAGSQPLLELTDAFRSKVNLVYSNILSSEDQTENYLKSIGYTVKGVTHVEGYIFVILVDEFTPLTDKKAL